MVMIGVMADTLAIIVAAIQKTTRNEIEDKQTRTIIVDTTMEVAGATKPRRVTSPFNSILSNLSSMLPPLIITVVVVVQTVEPTKPESRLPTKTNNIKAITPTLA